MSTFAPGLFPKFQAFDSNGAPLSHGKLYTYRALSTSPLATYTDATGGTENTNPVRLDSAGRAAVWLPAGVAYKFVLVDAEEVPIDTIDNYQVQLTDAGALTGYSTTLEQMQAMTDPGELGSEHLGVPLTGELEHLRYAVWETKATLDPSITEWYQTLHITGGDPGEGDITAPASPAGLMLTTGITTNPDGTVAPWVEASWTANTEPDLAGYELYVTVPTSAVPSIFTASAGSTAYRLHNVPGAILLSCRILAFDKTYNRSALSATAQITTGTDTVAPSPPGALTAHGVFRAIALLWNPAAAADYDHTEVWGSQTNNRATAVQIGSGQYALTHDGLPSGQTWYYWLRSVDRSGNMSAFTPGDTAGLSATTAVTVSDDIGNLSITETKIADLSISTPKLQANSVDANKITTGELITLGAQIRSAILTDAHIVSLSADKITTGTLDVLVGLGVGAGTIWIDGVNRQIIVYDANGTPRTVLGKFGALGTQFGVLVFNASGQMMFNVDDGGVTAAGIKAGVVQASHLRTDTAVITGSAQIADAIITDAKIQTLTADKITTGTLTAFIGLGVGAGSMYLDGANRRLVVHDTNGTVRAILGRTVDNTDYGLQIYNAAAQLMWNITSGVTTPGITPNAVTERVLFFNGNLVSVVQGFEIVVATLTFPTLAAGDQIFLSATMTGAAAGTGYITVVLREDWGGGNALHSTDHVGVASTTMTVQYVHTIGGALTNKSYVLTLRSTPLDAGGGLWQITFTGIRFQR